MNTRRITAVLSMLAGLALSIPASAELNAYMSIKGQKQGDIKGSVTQKGREGKIMVIATDHQIVSPRDIASGLPTGKRQHKPLIITKEIDRSTPLLYNALVNNENLPMVQIQYWAPQIKAASGVGSEVQYYTVTLTNANIASIRQAMPNNHDPALSNRSAYEEVSLTYQKIQWTWNDGGISAQDDWEAKF